MSDSQTVALGELHRNDYNPRKNAESDIESLKDSIEKEGLIQALTVRPNSDGYEVISGERRLSALRELYDADYDVAVNIRDVDDSRARRLALIENIEREDLTPIEEAWAFAQEIHVEVDGEETPYDEYVSSLGTHESADYLHLPSKKNSAVQDFAEGLDRSTNYVADHISFLTLPEENRIQIEVGDLPKRVARKVARIREDTLEGREKVILSLTNSFDDGLGNADWDTFTDLIGIEIDDAEAKAEAIDRIVNRVGGDITGNDVTRREIQRCIKSEEKRYEERQGLKEEELGDQHQLVENREQDTLAELSNVATFARQFFGSTFSFGEITEDVSGSAIDDIWAEVESELQSRKDDLSWRADDAADRVDDFSKRSGRLDRAIEILREEPLFEGFDDSFGEIPQIAHTVNAELRNAEEEQSQALEERRMVVDSLRGVEDEYNQLERARESLAELEQEVGGDA